MIGLELAGVLSEAEAVTMIVATTRVLRMHRMTETLISSRKIAVEKTPRKDSGVWQRHRAAMCRRGDRSAPSCDRYCPSGVVTSVSGGGLNSKAVADFVLVRRLNVFAYS